MRYTFLSFLMFVALLSSCQTNGDKEKGEDVPKEVTSLRGKYIRVDDNGRAGTEKFITIIREIEFKGEHCHFKYLGTPMSGKFEIDENYVYITTGGELGMMSMEIINKNHLKGEGYIHGVFKLEGTFDLEASNNKSTSSKRKPSSDYASKNPFEEKETEVSNPFGSSVNDSRPSSDYVEISSPEYSDNPFAGGSGEGGFGNDGSGSGGQGNGVGGDYGSRKIVRTPDLSNIRSDIDAQIELMLTIDSKGIAVDVRNVASRTTISDQRLINKVIMEVKHQIRYDKSPGAALTKLRYTVKLRAK